MENKGLWGGLLEALKEKIKGMDGVLLSDHGRGYVYGIKDAMKEIEKVAKWERFLGKTREEVKKILGEPIVGGITRKCRHGAIYKYGDFELYFQPWKLGKCVSVFDESKHQLVCEARGKYLD